MSRFTTKQASRILGVGKGKVNEFIISKKLTIIGKDYLGHSNTFDSKEVYKLERELRNEYKRKRITKNA